MRRSTVAAALLALLLPAVTGGIALASSEDRAERVDRVRAAVVNLDRAVTVTDPQTGEEEPVLAGRLLAGELTAGDDALLGWELADAAAAESGLRDGTYQAAITIPRDFSAAATSVQGDQPRQAVIAVETAEAGSPLAALVGEQVAEAAAVAVGDQLTSRYLDQVLLGFSGVSDSLADAAAGSEELSAGLADLAAGAGSAGAGADQLASGADDLASGVEDVAAGADDLAGGAGELAGGAAALADGLDDLAAGTRSLPQDARAVADGAARTSAGATQVADGLAALQQQCAAAVSPDGRAVCAGVAQLVPGARGVAAGTVGLASGTDGLADGLPQVAAGVRDARDGAARTAGGADALASGASELAEGAATAAGGAHELAAGAADLATGLDRLGTGATDAQAGATELADGLAQGAGELPAYSKEQRERLAATVADPVTSTGTGELEDVSGSVVPLLTVLVLWFGALATFLVRRALPEGTPRVAASALRLTLRAWAPAAMIGLGQTLALVAVVAHFDVDVASPVAAVAVGLLAAQAFTALHQALAAVAGRVGHVLSLVLLVVQVASVGAIVPLDTAPQAFQLLGEVLPLPLAVDALTTLVRGADAPLAGAVVGLLACTLLALAVTAVTARGRQQWSVAAIRREVGALRAVPQAA